MSHRSINGVGDVYAKIEVYDSTLLTWVFSPAISAPAGSTTVTATITGSVKVTQGFSLAAYDYVSLSTGATTEAYTFKTGGSGGTTVGTITITYTDSNATTIANVTKT